MRKKRQPRYRDPVTQFFVHSWITSRGFPLHVAVDRQGVVHRVSFCSFESELSAGGWERNKYACGEVEFQLEEYLQGERDGFTLSVALGRGTSFQQAVWQTLRKVAYGTTVSYGELARRIGRRDAARAVGTAVGRNPIAVIVPCHRVLPMRGGIGEYARRNLPAPEGRMIKRNLLNLERGESALGGVHLQ